jgi:hypothetical protein
MSKTSRAVGQGMTVPTLPPFPDLSRVAFRNDDPSDHDGGGHCAGLPGDTLHSKWNLVYAQHLIALDCLVDAAGEEGWDLTRPIMFAAHHVCEVALKTAWVGLMGTDPMPGHPLRPHWTRLAIEGGLRHLSAEDIREASDFLKLMRRLTPDGQSTRYPLPGRRDIGAAWCCVSAGDLRKAVFAFTSRLDGTT